MTGVRPQKRALLGLNRVLAAAGLKLKRASSATRFWPEGLQNMRRIGYRPSAVVDVGVLRGTFELYEGCPGAPLILVEPMPRCELNLKRICAQFGGTYHLAAAGSRDGETEFSMRQEDLGASSISMEGRGGAKTITVPMRRLDSLVLPGELGDAALLKVDVEGFELDVIRGLGALSRCFEVIILETRFFKYDDAAFEFTEVVQEMSALGFVVYDIWDGGYRPYDGVLDMVDLVFVRKDGYLRSRIGRRYC